MIKLIDPKSQRNKLGLEGLKSTMRDIMKQEENIQVYTGLGGIYNFDTEMVIEGLDHEQLKNRFRNLREEKYKLDSKLRKLNSNFIIKILKFFKIINI